MGRRGSAADQQEEKEARPRVEMSCEGGGWVEYSVDMVDGKQTDDFVWSAIIFALGPEAD
jgi:hypothetical protein